MTTHRAGRAPNSPPERDESDELDWDGPDMAEIDVGKRFSDNPEVLRLERELVADGVELDNRAVPLSDHPEHHAFESTQEIREAIESEADSEHPNKARIGVLNDLLSQFGGTA